LYAFAGRQLAPGTLCVDAVLATAQLRLLRQFP
jgi:hypothetical protein